MQTLIIQHLQFKTVSDPLLCNGGQEALMLNEYLHTEHLEHHDFGTLSSNYLSMTGGNRELEFYLGGLRARYADDSLIFDQFD